VPGQHLLPARRTAIPSRMQYAGSHWLLLAAKHVQMERSKAEVAKRARAGRYIEILEAKVAALEQVRVPVCASLPPRRRQRRDKRTGLHPAGAVC
jgi:hypothetical protein